MTVRRALLCSPRLIAIAALSGCRADSQHGSVGRHRQPPAAVVAVTRSRAARSTATCASPARWSPTNRPKSAPRPPAAWSRSRSSAARAFSRARCSPASPRPRPPRSFRRRRPTPRRSRRGSASLAGQPFDAKQVPDVRTPRRRSIWAEAEFNRIRSLLDQKVVSQSEFDQRRTQVEAARQQYQAAQNSAQQSYRSLQAARARVSLARKAVADTGGPRAVRRPRRRAVVSVGDYVTRGTKVATVVRVDPLRARAHGARAVRLGRQGRPAGQLTVDAYPDAEFDGEIRFVSPSLRADQRALTVEAIVPNADGRLKPGLFATARIRQAGSARAARSGDVRRSHRRHQPRLRRQGQPRRGAHRHGRRDVRRPYRGHLGLAKGESVATDPKGRLADGQTVASR